MLLVIYFDGIIFEDTDIILNDFNFIMHKDLSHVHLLYIEYFYSFCMFYIW